MGQCGYVNDEKSGPWNGYYCNRIGGFVTEDGLTKYYCSSSVACQYCPYLGGDDRYRREPEKKETPRREEADNTGEYIAHDLHSGGGTGGTVSSGGGGSGCLLLGILGGLGSTLLWSVAITAVLAAVFLVARLFGFAGYWVTMQVPQTADVENMSLYSVSWEGRTRFETTKEAFEEDGSCSLGTHEQYSDIYLENSGASVWLGTCHLTFLNTAVVEDISYEEIAAQLVRPVILQIRLEDGSAAEGLSLGIADEQAQILTWLSLGEGKYAVLLPNDTQTQAMTVSVESYAPLTLNIDPTQRLSGLEISLVKSGGAE